MDIERMNMTELDYVVNNPGVVNVHGIIGAGKTSTAFKLVELMHKNDPDRGIYVYALDPSKGDELLELLPDYFQITESISMKGLDNNSVLVSDEAWYHSSSKVKHKNEEIMAIMDNLFLSRQRGQTLISIIQSLAILEKTYFRSGFSLISKYTPMSTIAMERPELLDILSRYQRGIEFRLNEFPYIPWQSACHVQSPLMDMNNSRFRFEDDFNFGYYWFKLPSFWTEKLSVFWSRYT